MTQTGDTLIVSILAELPSLAYLSYCPLNSIFYTLNLYGNVGQCYNDLQLPFMQDMLCCFHCTVCMMYWVEASFEIELNAFSVGSL